MNFCKIFKIANTTMLITVDVIDEQTVVVQQLVQTETSFFKMTKPIRAESFTEGIVRACSYVDGVSQEDAETELCEMMLALLNHKAGVQ